MYPVRSVTTVKENHVLTTSLLSTVECVGDQECVSEAIYKNDTLDLMNRMCLNKTSCLNSCGEKSGPKSEQTCIFCRAKILCNPVTPKPSSTTVSSKFHFSCCFCCF